VLGEKVSICNGWKSGFSPLVPAMISGRAFALALIVASLNVGALAQPEAFAVASFDDMQSYIISTDGQFLQGSLVINQNITSSNKISVFVHAYGDIASVGGLDDGTELAFFYFSSCTKVPCTVSFDSVPAGAWCGVIGSGVTIAVDGVDTGIKAVFGLGKLSSTSKNCTFANAYNTQPAFAIVKVLPVGSNGANGTVIFQLVDNALSVSGVISGLNGSASHGIHVHAFGDVRDTLLAALTGPHFSFNPQVHGLLNNATRHTGDLGNFMSDANGVAAFNILVPQDMAPDVALTLLAQGGNAIGRAIIVHANVDDGVTQPSGNAGLKLGQGVIGYADTVSSDSVLALLEAAGSPFGCGCTLTDEATGVTYNGFCKAEDCKQQTWTALILVVTLGPLSVLLVLALMKFQTWRTSSPSRKVGVVRMHSGKGGEASLPLLSA